MEIKPCPFCSSEKVRLVSCFTNFIHCTECGANGPSHKDKQIAKATEAWNRVSKGVNNSPDKCS